MQEVMIKKAAELLENGTVNRVMGWKAGEFIYDVTPAVFETAEELKDFVYGDFCAPNLSKYMVAESKKAGKILVFLKPCDTYSFNELLCEHRINRDGVYVVGIPCDGKIDIEKIQALAGPGIIDIKREEDKLKVETAYGVSELERNDVKLDRCLVCKSHKHVAYDELIGEDGELRDSKRFDEVEKLENMTPEERFAFWRGELSKCIRCNACRNVCPACTCEKCVFDNPASGVENKAASTSFEENMFHIIRAFHVAGRCTDCGECSRVCPQHIPLHLLNRKFIKDINELYGEYQAGADPESRSPVVDFTKNDAEPGIIYERGGNE